MKSKPQKRTLKLAFNIKKTLIAILSEKDSIFWQDVAVRFKPRSEPVLISMAAAFGCGLGLTGNDVDIIVSLESEHYD